MTAPNYERVDDSMEAALGAGILTALLEQAGAGSTFFRGIECDPNQVGADAVMYAHMAGDVILRIRVDEVRDVGRNDRVREALDAD